MDLLIFFGFICPMMANFLHKRCILISVIIISIIVFPLYEFSFHYIFRNSGSNFKEYYKIDYEKASKVLFDTKGQRLGPFLSDVVDARVNQYSSFVITGIRGSGKTRLWTHLKSNISKDHLVVEPLQEVGPLLQAI